MLDITKVKYTRAGYPVHNIREYKQNDTFTLLADIEYKGQVECETYTKEGRYYIGVDVESSYDLVEEPTSGTYRPTNGIKTKLTLLTNCLDSLTCSIAVCLREIEDIKEEEK